MIQQALKRDTFGFWKTMAVLDARTEMVKYIAIDITGSELRKQKIGHREPGL